MVVRYNLVMTDDAGGRGATIPSDDFCLGFVNTRYWRGMPAPTEELNEPQDIAAWLARAAPGLAGPARAHAVRWRADPKEGTRALGAARELREMLYRTLAEAAAGAVPDLSALNKALAQAAPRRRLVCEGGAAGWEIPAAAGPVARLLSPVLWSAADLLTGPRRARLRACANPKCGWLFLDDSKSANRRWCAMSACGNRAKAQRHYQRAKAARQDSPA